MLLDCYARAYRTFSWRFPLQQRTDYLEVLNETNITGASDELIAQVAQLLVNHARSGPVFFQGMLDVHKSAAWCCRLLLPVLEQVCSSERVALQKRAVCSPEPHLFLMLQSAHLLDPTVNRVEWLHYCGNVDALSMLLEQFEVDSCYCKQTALFGAFRYFRTHQHAFNQVTHTLLNAGADPHLLVGFDHLPRVAVLEAVFKRVPPRTLFPTTADLLHPEAALHDGPALVSLLLKHRYSVDEVRCVL